MMTMKQILTPIENEIKAFETLIDQFVGSVANERVKANYEAFFKVRGKYLRPSLLLLSAGAIAGNKARFDDKLYKLGLILELLHSASLVHDDVVDEDLERRGEKTVNQIFGNKIAVLAGDTLFSYAFREATIHYDKAFCLPVTELALNMCMAELEQANKVDSLESYLRVIKGKTAEFMAVACELGARYGGGSEAEISHMREIGMNIGMTYQMVDDIIDEDPNALKYIDETDVEEMYMKTRKMLTDMEANDYQQGLIDLLDFMKAMKE